MVISVGGSYLYKLRNPQGWSYLLVDQYKLIHKDGHICWWISINLGWSYHKDGHICWWISINLGIHKDGHICWWISINLGIHKDGHICWWISINLGIHLFRFNTRHMSSYNTNIMVNRRFYYLT